MDLAVSARCCVVSECFCEQPRSMAKTNRATVKQWPRPLLWSVNFVGHLCRKWRNSTKFPTKEAKSLVLRPALFRGVGTITGCQFIAELLLLTRFKRKSEFDFGGIDRLIFGIGCERPITSKI